MTQRQINEIIRVKFNEEIWNTVGEVPTVYYYNDVSRSTGNRRKIFKVYGTVEGWQRTLQVVWGLVKGHIDKFDPGWEVLVKRDYVALVKYEKSQQHTAEHLTASYKERVRKSTDTLFNVTSFIAESIESLGYNADEVYAAIDVVDIAIKKHLNSL